MDTKAAILSSSEIKELIRLLECLADIAKTLGHVEDSIKYRDFADSLKRRLIGRK